MDGWFLVSVRQNRVTFLAKTRLAKHLNWNDKESVSELKLGNGNKFYISSETRCLWFNQVRTCLFLTPEELDRVLSILKSGHSAEVAQDTIRKERSMNQ